MSGGLRRIAAPSEPFNFCGLLPKVPRDRVAVARVKGKGDVNPGPSQQSPESLKLIVGKRVHRIEEDRLHASGTFLLALEDSAKHGEKECLGFPRAGGSRHDKGSTSPASLKPTLLVPVEALLSKRPVSPTNLLINPPRLDKLSQRSRALEIPHECDAGTSHDDIGLCKMRFALPPQV